MVRDLLRRISCIVRRTPGSRGPSEDPALRTASGLFAHLDSKIHQIFEFLPIGVLETTQQGEVVFCNSFCASLFGFSGPEEFTAEMNSRSGGVRTLYVNAEVRDYLVRQLYRERQECCRFEDQFFTRDGKVVDLFFDFFLRHDAERNEECIFGFVQDVTERTEFERRLKASEMSYRDFIEGVNSIIVRLDGHGRIKYLNDFARHFFGHSLEEVQGRHFIGTILEGGSLGKSAVDKMMQNLCKGSDDASLKETMITGQDGRKAWISWTNKAIRESDGQVTDVLLVGTDVTDRKYFEQSLKQQLEMEMIFGQISARFANIGLDHLEAAVFFSLDKIKMFSEAAAAFYGCFNADGVIESLYISESPDKEKWEGLMRLFFPFSGRWWFERLEASEGSFFSEIAAMPEEFDEAKEAAHKAGLQGLRVVPLFREGRLTGLAGIHMFFYHAEQGYSETGLLKVCGDMFLNLLERKKFHDQIAEARERFDVAVRGAYLGMYDWDIASGNVFYNDIWFRMLGYSPHDFPHTFETWKSFLHPEDAKRVLEALDGYLKGSRAFYRTEYRLKTKEGGWKWILADGNIKKRTEDGAPVRMVGLHRDITELKAAELKLRHQKDIVDSLIENMPLGIFAKDVHHDFRILVWNRRMEELFGIARQEVLGKADCEIFSQEQAERYLKDDQDVAETGNIKFGIHEKIQTPSGELRVQTTKVPVLDENGKARVIFGILEDVTEKEHLEMSLRQTQKMQAVGQLAAGVAHEVKNPLAIILLAAEGLEMNKDVMDNQKIQSKVQMIKTASEKANRVIIELLKFSRLADVEMERIDLHQVIDDAYFLAKNRGKEKNIEFEKQCHDGPLACLGNAVLLEQVFVNLFNNAIDAIEGAGWIVVRTAVHGSAGGRKNITVEVEDSGPGIPEEILSKIFDPFYTTKDAGSGTGLGLSTVFTILEKHGGSVRVDRKFKEGTRFIITVPFGGEEVLTVSAERD